MSHKGFNNARNTTMGLVDYSDSDDSDKGETPVVKTTVTTSKGSFQKVVDRSNPGKIRVSLPQPPSKDETNGDGPQPKRLKTGGGGLGGFNSFLPAPKRTIQTPTVSLGGGNATRPSGLAAGVSLKTGAAPGFSREPEPEYENPGLQSKIPSNTSGAQDNEAGSNPLLPMTEDAPEKSGEELKLIGKPLMFKPLSVSRKPAKKKKLTESTTSTSFVTKTSSTLSKDKSQPQRQKISLFSVSNESNESDTASARSGDYEPILYGAGVEEAGDGAIPEYQGDTFNGGYEQNVVSVLPPTTAPQIGAQSLNDIASDLHLSAAERRQLFGRQKGGSKGSMLSATKVINFNTDEEYKHNEELRASGEQAVHNPVRAIAPGKHNLKQLVNAAASQKEALEESFAKGKSTRAEASSRYGW